MCKQIYGKSRSWTAGAPIAPSGIPLLATFGQEDLLPLWVADMDFKAPKCVRDALHQAVEQGAFGYYRVPDAYYESILGWGENPTRYMLAAGVDSDNIGRCFRPFSADSGHHSAG